MLAVILAPMLVACSGDSNTGRPDAPTIKPRDCGIASFYHASLAGELTANGEIYDPRRMTAAHRDLPFGTRLRVRRRGTGASVTVVINDRGPFVEGRVIDLSQAAARKIGLTDGTGIAEICMTQLS